MDIEVTVDEKDLHNATINIINEGRASASKFILTLQAPQNISSYNVFTTDNYTADYVENSTSLELYFPRFTYGEGSLIRVNMSLDNKSNITSGYYTAYATYDQGSYKKVLPITQISLSFDERFREFWRVNGSLISLIVGIITSFTLLLTLKKIRRSGKEIPGK
jgi:hypothetical protein